MNTIYCDYHLLLGDALPRVDVHRNPEHPAYFFVSIEPDHARFCASGTHAQLTRLLAELQAALDQAAGRPTHMGALAGLLAAIRDLANIQAFGDDPYRTVLSDGQRAQECAHRLAFLTRALTTLLDTDPGDTRAQREVAERLRTRAGSIPPHEEPSAA
jgi:hypothetical protein